MESIYKYPFLTGFSVFIITYIILWWYESKKNPENTNSKYPSVFIPIFSGIAIIIFLLLVPNEPPKIQTGGMIEKSYYMKSRDNIKLPDLDVFIDIAKF